MTEAQRLFFSRLERLNTGDRAALRRCAGTMLREADGNAMTVFYRCLPPSIGEAQAGKWFAVACISCLWDPDGDTGKPVEEVLSDLIRREELSDSTKHRVEMLLDTKWDSDGYLIIKITRLLKLVRQKSDRVRIDFAALLEDLLRWNNDSQIVQRKWARTIFANNTIDTNDTEE